MDLLEMPSQTLDIWKHGLSVAIKHQALQSSKFRAHGPSLLVVVQNRFVLLVNNRFFAVLFLKLLPSQLLVFGYDDLFKLGFANGALGVFHNDSESQTTLLTCVFVVALSHGEKVNLVVAQNAVVRVTYVTLNSFSCFDHTSITTIYNLIFCFNILLANWKQVKLLGQAREVNLLVINRWLIFTNWDARLEP